jgi:hypothetical protein
MTPDDMEGRLEDLLAFVGQQNTVLLDREVPNLKASIRALLLDYQERGREIEKLHAAISWLEPPLIDESTSESELRTRIGFMIADRDRATLKGKSHD